MAIPRTNPAKPLGGGLRARSLLENPDGLGAPLPQTPPPPMAPPQMTGGNQQPVSNQSGFKPPQPLPPQMTGGNQQPMTADNPQPPVQTRMTGGNAQPLQSGTQTASGNGQSQQLARAFTGSMDTFSPFADAAYQASTRRLDPQFAQADAAFRQQMVNQGLSEGTEAYDKAFANFSRDKNDAYSNARNESLAQALAAQGQAFGQDFGQQRADMSDLMGLLGYGNSVTQGNNQTLNADQARANSMFGFIPGMSPTPVDVMGTSGQANSLNMFNQQQNTNRNNAYWQAAGQLGSAFLGGG